jgi:predicted ester cyclase
MTDTDAASNQAVLERSLVEFSKGFGDPAAAAAYFDLYAPGVVFHDVGPGVETVDDARAFYTQIWTALPDGRLDVLDCFAAGDRVAVRVRVSGTHTGGELLGVPPAGAALAFEAITILRFEDGHVAERWNRLDELGLLTGLGVLPAPAPA